MRCPFLNLFCSFHCCNGRRTSLASDRLCEQSSYREILFPFLFLRFLSCNLFCSFSFPFLLSSIAPVTFCFVSSDRLLFCRTYLCCVTCICRRGFKSYSFLFFLLGPFLLQSENLPGFCLSYHYNDPLVRLTDDGSKRFWLHYPGLSGQENTVSLESADHPGHFVTHVKYASSCSLVLDFS